MRHRIRSHLTYANVMSTLAVFLVLGGGTALASYVISSNRQVGPGTISGHHPPGDMHPNIIVGSVGSRDIADNTLTGADIEESKVNGGGDVSGSVANLQLKTGSVGLDELRSGGPLGDISFFEFSVPANDCVTKTFADDQADLGEVLLPQPESSDLGSGMYLRPTVVAHPGQAVLELCNSTGSAVTIPFGTFFDLRLIG